MGVWTMLHWNVQTFGLTPVLHVTPVLQSKSLRHVTVQLKTPTVVVAAHLESMPGATPQSWSSAVAVVEVLVVEVQVVWLNWFNAVQVLTRSEHMSAI